MKRLFQVFNCNYLKILTLYFNVYLRSIWRTLLFQQENTDQQPLNQW